MILKNGFSDTNKAGNKPPSPTVLSSFYILKFIRIERVLVFGKSS